MIGYLYEVAILCSGTGLAKSQKDRRLALDEATSRRWDAVVHSLTALPFFLVEKATTWPAAAIWCGYFFFVYGAEHLAGEDTSLILGAAIDLGKEVWPYWVIIGIETAAIVLLVYTFHSYVKRKGQREKQLEGKIDPGRSSSGMTESGQPPK